MLQNDCSACRSRSCCTSRRPHLTAVPAMSRPASRSRSVAEQRWRRRVRRASRGGNPVAGPAATVRGRRV